MNAHELGEVKRRLDTAQETADQALIQVLSIEGGQTGFLPVVNVVKAFGVDNTGLTDAWPKLLAAITTLTAFGLIAYMPNGTYKCATAPTYNQIPNGAQLWMAGPGVTINSVLPFVDGHTSTPFYRNGWTHLTALTTLNANVVQGTPTLVVVSNAGMAVGQDIVLSSQDAAAEMQAGYTIQKIVGTTITVDRPVLKPFTAGAFVALSPGFPRNITILGNGAKMTGSGDRWVQFVMARDCLISGFHLSGLDINQIVCSYDYGSLRSVFDRMVLDTSIGSNVYQWAFALEDGEFSRIQNSYAEGPITAGTGFGFVINECEQCTVIGCTAESLSQAGFYSTYEGTGARGTHGGGFYNCNAIECASNGFQYEFATGVTTDNCTSQYSGGQGFSCFNQTTDIRFRGCSAISNAVNGFNLASGATFSASMVDCETSGNGGIGVYPKMDTEIVRLDTTENPGISIDTANIVLELHQWRHNGNFAGFAAAFTCSAAGCVITADQIRIESMAGAGTKFGFELVAASTLNIDHYVCVPAIHSGIYIDDTAQVRVGSSVDVSATTNGFFNNGTATPAYNFGTVTLAGGAGVAISFPNVNARDQLQLTRKTAGGAPAAGLSYTITPGTGATVTGTAGDTSTLSYKFVTGA